MNLLKYLSGTRKEQFLVLTLFFVGVGSLAFLIFYEPPIFYDYPQPWILGLYSLPHFIFLVLAIPLILWIMFLFLNHKFQAFQILLKRILQFLLLLILLEFGGQIYAGFNPGYEVLWMYPHKILGWTFPPNSEYNYTGRFWYAREFSGYNKTNSIT